MSSAADSQVPQGTADRPMRSVARRLMASFALLASIPLIAGIVGWSSNRAVDEPLERVGSLTAAIGVHDRAYRSWGRSLNSLFAQPQRFESRDALAQSSLQVEQALEGMKGNLELLAGNPHLHKIAGLLRQHDVFARQLRATLATTGRRIALAEQALLKVAVLESAVRKISDTTALAAASGQAAGHAEVQRRLDELRYNALTLGILGREASTVRETGRLASRRQEFAEKLQSALQDMAQLPDNDYRRELAAEFETIYDVSIAPDGLFDEFAATYALRQVEQRERHAVRIDGLRATEMLAGIDRETDEETRQSLLTVKRALQRSDQSLMAVGAISSLLALLVMLAYVRGNVLRRLTGLTQVTEKLTHGELETPVQVEGRDELTELALALETFRRSALRLRENERMLARRTEELEFLNKELDQFAYVASHDLKAPMRAIDSLADFLREDLGDKLDGDSAKHLDMMQGRINRLGGLLDSLLEYSRAGRLRSPPEPLDLRELVMNCVDLVGPQGAQVELTGSFGKVHSWKTPLEQVVRNLLDNAFKHNDPDYGLVSIDGEIIGKEIRLIIADNGPGIHPKFHERIFGMFQTLQPRDKIEGSGMGLAILKKLVDTHGGSISVQSEPDRMRGTRFRLNWPVTAVIQVAADDPLDSLMLASLARAG